MTIINLLTVALFSIVASIECLSSFTDKIHHLENFENLRYSGKGINEVGQYNACLRKNWQYLLLTGNTVATRGISLGICLPQECNIDEINSALHTKNIILQRSEEFTISLAGVFFITIMFFILATKIASTIFHYYSEKYLDYKIISCFSGINTMTNLMKIRENNKFGCLNGLKVLSFAWVIYGHIFVMKSASSIINFERTQDLMYQWWGVLLYSGFFAVDIFFYVTGLLFSYFLLAELEKSKGKMKWGLLYFHRIIRIVPTYAFMIGFCYFALPLLGSGPAWGNAFKYIGKDCADYWWTNLLFINNFIPDGKGNNCFGIGWYLANDMQFFLIGPLLIFLYFKSKNKIVIWSIIILLMLACMITTYIIGYENNLHLSRADPTNMEEGDNKWFQILYIKPYTRIVVYFQGLLTGILYSYYQKISEKQEILFKDGISQNIVTKIIHGNIISRVMMICGVILMYYFIIFQQEIYDDITNSEIWSRNTNAIALAVHRFGFILGLTLFILPVLMNKAKFISSILGNSALEPLAKISFCGFLVHLGVEIGYNASQNNTLFAGIYFFKEFFSFFPIVIIGGLLLHITIEAPFQNLEKILFRK